ncbi:MAG: GNAT family N-acetyltransferase [Chloroflexi bacterium]|nr:GNAT family N-acetyltransferase [Chloroflexota bacterium]
MIPLALQLPAPSIPIRPVRLTDSEPLHATCWPNRPFTSVYNLVSHALQNAADGRGLGVVVLDDTGAPLGYGQMALWPSCAEISDLMIAQTARGQGYGTAIIQYLVQAAAQMHAQVIEIGVALTNPRALALYRRLGFVDSHTVMLNLGQGKEPVLFLRLDLP